MKYLSTIILIYTAILTILKFSNVVTISWLIIFTPQIIYFSFLFFIFVLLLIICSGINASSINNKSKR
jgi:hypothetical protein